MASLVSVVFFVLVVIAGDFFPFGSNSYSSMVKAQPATCPFRAALQSRAAIPLRASFPAVPQFATYQKEPLPQLPSLPQLPADNNYRSYVQNVPTGDQRPFADRILSSDTYESGPAAPVLPVNGIQPAGPQFQSNFGPAAPVLPVNGIQPAGPQFQSNLGQVASDYQRVPVTYGNYGPPAAQVQPVMREAVSTYQNAPSDYGNFGPPGPPGPSGPYGPPGLFGPYSPIEMYRPCPSCRPRYIDCRRPCFKGRCEPRCRRYRHHRGHKVYRRHGYRPRPIKSNYPAFFPYLTLAAKPPVQNVNVQVDHAQVVRYKQS